MKTESERIYDANRAKEILENEIFVRVFADIEQELTEAWKTSPKRDLEGREKIHQSLTQLMRVQACLQTYLETGKLATDQLKYKQTIADRLKSSVGLSL